MVTKIIPGTVNFEAMMHRTSNIGGMHSFNRLFIERSQSIYYVLDFRCWGNKTGKASTFLFECVKKHVKDIVAVWGLNIDPGRFL